MHIECSLTLFLSLTLHFICSCLMKSHQIEYWSHFKVRRLLNILSVKDTWQTPNLIEKKFKIKVSNKWYNHSYDNSGNDNNGIHNSSYDTTFEYNHILFLSKSLILPVVVNIRDVNVPCSMSRTLSSLCRCMTNPPRLQIMALSNVQTCPHTLLDTWREYHRLASHIVVWQHYRTPV